MVKPKFLHGKMYHIQKTGGVQNAIVGSSNFTVNGLGFGHSPNIELNMEVTEDRNRKDLLKWFEEIWNDNTGLVEDVKEEVIKYIEQLYAENSPEFIYFKTLYHIFGEYILEQDAEKKIDEQTGFINSKIWNKLYTFQKEAVSWAKSTIYKYNGCIIADSVGLGKTFEALAIIKYFENLNQRVLVLCPKKIMNNWLLFKNNDRLNPLLDDKLRFDILAHTDLSRKSGTTDSGINLATFNWSNYDLVVIDESHNFRNDTKGKRDENGNIIRKSRYEKLMQDIIQAGTNTKVLLLSATPVNNDLKDLRNQVYLITAGEDDSFYEKMGVHSIKQTMKNAQTVFSKWADPKNTAGRSAKELLTQLDSSFVTLLSKLTLARSRKHIQQYYREEMEKIGAFPKRLRPVPITTGIDTLNEFPAYDEINEKILEYKLSLYNPTAYVRDEWREHYGIEDKQQKFSSQETREYYLIGMMKTNFLKRLESSVESFEISLRRTIEKIDVLQERIYDFREKINSNSGISFNELETNDDDDDELKEAFDDAAIGKKLRFRFEHLDLDSFLADLNKDREALSALKQEAEKITPARDKKLQELKRIISDKVANPINAGNKKVLVFTAFADTAKYLYSNLLDFVHNELGLHTALVTGAGENKTTLGNSGFGDIITNFSPLSKERDKMDDMPQNEEINVLIATDCLSEGQNLQDCDFLINYDIHWNPVRIIQRFGRIDRLGSRNKQIKLVNFWPTEDLDEYIDLKRRVEAKMELVNIAATGDEDILSLQEKKALAEEQYDYRAEQLKRLKNEVVDLEDFQDGVSLSEFSLEDFRVGLLNYISSNLQRLEDSPLGLYAVVPSPIGEYKDMSLSSPSKNIEPGVIFCLRQLGNSDGTETVNSTAPYFLVYINEDGQVRYNYTHAKQILEIFKQLSLGIQKPYQELCDIFNENTADGDDMNEYNALLQNAVKEIVSVFRKRESRKLTSDRNAVLIPDTKRVRHKDNFELITWLVIL